MVIGQLAEGALVEDGFNESGAFTAMVLELEPGPAAMALLCSIDPDVLEDSERIWVLQAWERQNAWLMAQTQKALVAVAGEQAPNRDDWVREEVAAAIGLSTNAAGQRMHVARTLLGELPATMTALERGALPWRHALAMVEICYDLDPGMAALLEQRVLKRGGDQSLSQFRRSLKRAALTVAPEQARLRQAKAALARDVQLFPAPDGMATLSAMLPALDALAVYEAIDAAARATEGTIDDNGCKLGIDARRADALIALVTGTPASGAAPRRRIELQVVVDLTTLAGLTDNPAELVGYGPICGSSVRHLVGETPEVVLRRLVTDPLNGELLDYGRKTYRPPLALRDFVQARDRSCRFPGCGRPAKRCDIDHGLAWDAGGHTSARNCGCLCRRHHRAKTKGGWELVYLPDGTAQWTSPAGQRYSVRPPPQLGDA